MEPFSYFVGLDVHRQTISYCVKKADGGIEREGRLESKREALEQLGKQMGPEYLVGLEATICSHWIYNFLKPYAGAVWMGQPAKLKALQASKRKNDELDARTLADLLRCDLFPRCYVMPIELEMLRRQLRYRALLIREQTLFKNKAAGLLIECGVPYETRKLHSKKYFQQLLKEGEGMSEELRALLRLNRQQLEGVSSVARSLVKALKADPALRQRLLALSAIDGVGEITALTWALEVGQPQRFPNHNHAVSYCGLCKAENNSAGKEKRGPLSKKRNAILQTVLIETAHLAPQYNAQLRQTRDKALARGAKPNEAVIAVARKLVRYLLAVDRQYFAQRENAAAAGAPAATRPPLVSTSAA